MAQKIVPANNLDEVTLVKLARELAKGILPVTLILSNFKVTAQQFEVIKENPAFQRLYESELADWSAAMNTPERVKVKSAAILEEWLPEAYARMNDKGENLNAKVELGKLIAKLAGMGLNNVATTEVGERFSVTINLGADTQLKFEKQSAPVTIEGEIAA